MGTRTPRKWLDIPLSRGAYTESNITIIPWYRTSTIQPHVYQNLHTTSDGAQSTSTANQGLGQCREIPRFHRAPARMSQQDGTDASLTSQQRDYCKTVCHRYMIYQCTARPATLPRCCPVCDRVLSPTSRSGIFYLYCASQNTLLGNRMQGELYEDGRLHITRAHNGMW